MDVMTGQPHLTLHSESVAEFWLNDLEPGSTFMLYLYAVNIKGLSQPVVLPVSTLKEAAKRTVPPSTDPFSSSVVGVVAMGTGAGILLVSAIVVVACIRCRSRQNTSTTTTTTLAASATDEANHHLQYIQQQQTHTNGVGYQSVNKSHHKLTLDNGELTAETHPLTSVGCQDDRNASFYRRASNPSKTTAPPPYVDNKRTCLKLPPDFVNDMADVPESCV